MPRENPGVEKRRSAEEQKNSISQNSMRNNEPRLALVSNEIAKQKSCNSQNSKNDPKTIVCCQCSRQHAVPIVIFSQKTRNGHKRELNDLLKLRKGKELESEKKVAQGSFSQDIT